MQEPAKPVLTSVPLDSGVRFGLDEAAFAQWWNAIPEADREGFKFHAIALGPGAIFLAKFVCAYDYIVHHQRERSRPNAIATAYAAAYGLDARSHVCRVKGAAAFEHHAVQYLLDQFDYRGIRAARERYVPRATYLLGQMLDDAAKDDATLTDRVRVFDSFVKFHKSLQTEDVQMRGLRNKASVKNAMERTFRDVDEIEEQLTDEDLEKHLSDLGRLFGKEKVVALMRAAPETDEEQRPAAKGMIDLAADAPDDEPAD